MLVPGKVTIGVPALRNHAPQLQEILGSEAWFAWRHADTCRLTTRQDQNMRSAAEQRRKDARNEAKEETAVGIKIMISVLWQYRTAYAHRQTNATAKTHQRTSTASVCALYTLVSMNTVATESLRAAQSNTPSTEMSEHCKPSIL